METATLLQNDKHENKNKVKELYPSSFFCLRILKFWYNVLAKYKTRRPKHMFYFSILSHYDSKCKPLTVKLNIGNYFVVISSIE